MMMRPMDCGLERQEIGLSCDAVKSLSIPSLRSFARISFGQGICCPSNCRLIDAVRVSRFRALAVGTMVSSAFEMISTPIQVLASQFRFAGKRDEVQP